MNFPGRIIGGTLVAIAVAWILNIAGVFPFSGRSNNQIDSTAATNPNAPKTATQSFAASNSANRPGTQNYGAVSQNPGGTTSPANTTPSSTTAAPDGTANPTVGGAASAQTPAVRAGW